MVELCKFSGEIVNKVNDGLITDYYGRGLYIISGEAILNWDTRSVLYKYDGYYLRDFYGKIMYSFDGKEFKDFSGKILFTYKNNKIAKFAGLNEYFIKPNASNIVVASLIALFVNK